MSNERTLINIQAAGAVGDGKTLCTGVIQQAIDALAAVGGGTLVVPPGIYLTGMLRFCSGLTVELQPGGVLKASPRSSDYPAFPMSADEHFVSEVDLEERYFLYVKDAHSVRIHGGGTLDGSGHAFWNPPASCKFFVPKAGRVTRMLELADSKDVTLQGIEIVDSPGWTVHVNRCQNLRVQGVTIRNNLHGPNTDGIDVTDSSDVFVSDCTIYAGDDGIVLKSYGGVNERIHVTNCMIQTNCSALKLGANESFGTIRQVVMSNCVIRDSSRGISLYCMGGGTFEDVSFSNIVMECDNEIPLVNPIHIHASRNPDPSRDRGVGRIRNVRIGDVICRTDARILLTCEEGHMLENIHLHDILVHYEKVENRFELARRSEGKLQFSPFVPEARAAKAGIVACNIKGLTLRNLVLRWPDDPKADLHFLWARHVEEGFVDCPMARASTPEVSIYNIEESDIYVRDS